MAHVRGQAAQQGQKAMDRPRPGLLGNAHSAALQRDMERIASQSQDGGKILGTLAVPVLSPDTLDRVITATKQAGARLLISVLEQVRRGESVGVPVDMSEASYFSFPKREHVTEFRARGHRLI